MKNQLRVEGDLANSISRTKRGSQNTALLLHLAQGRYLTAENAEFNYNVKNLRARISELRSLLRNMATIPYVIPADITARIAPHPATGVNRVQYEITDRTARVHIGRYLNGLRRKSA